ncbi:RHS repeat domain-containing protein, partial [Rosenbergiella nectarea]|uniref:RHS repeat domain-containing protein n=1 Tax=Rosenbergiella nectarea TaxID=988801 RepID=UPI001F4DF535
QQAWGWEPGTLYGSKPLWQADLSPESTLKTAKVAWLIADNTGTPLLALNDQGQTVWKGTRDPFAAVVPNVESQITVNLRYAGQYADAETGLYYNGFRYYDPLTGRYLQPDPLGLSGGLNSYVYALNNPLSYIDPEGQFPLIALLKPMAYFVGGWAVGEAMDYLFSYLPDNECNPLLSPRNWAQTMSDFIPAGEVYKRIKEASAVWKLSFSEIRLIIKSAKSSYKNTTVVGHALSKHSGRHPETWGKMHGPVKLWHAQGMTHLKDVIRAPGEFKKIKTQKGDIFIEKRLSDGRGVRLNMDGTFKGFID